MTQSTPSPSDSPDESRPADAPEQADTAGDQTADQSVDQSADEQESSAWTATGDDLPELEELTPELVEEEAIRGDFMLRGAVILLAVLFGFLQIADSRVLVHIRSGEQMRENGFLPARTDAFSFAIEGETVANVSWLFDHVVSGVWSVGGPLGLTLFKAFTAGLIAWVITRISVPGLPTWWSSICGVVALAACASDLMPVTDLMTLLGLAIMLKLLHEAYQGRCPGLIWQAPLLIAIWTNLDTRAFLGVFALLLFSAGSVVARTPGESRETTSSGTLWTATALSAIALLVNPFPVDSALSVVQTYFTEYPGARALLPLMEFTIPLLDGRLENYSLLNVDAWGGFEFSFIAALAIVFLGAVTVVLARDHREAPWALLLGGFAALAIVTIHELPAAALVAAVAAGVVGQRYYQRTFPQEYTTKTSEVLFSRIGRAVTVFSFALLGFLVVTDRLPTRTAVGTGFTSDMATTMAALEKQLQELPEDAHVLHSRVDLGDYLIWAGRKSFVDTRITPFGLAGDPESANSRYRTARQDMLDSATAAARAVVATQQEAVQQAIDAANASAGAATTETATPDTAAPDTATADSSETADEPDATDTATADTATADTAVSDDAAEESASTNADAVSEDTAGEEMTTEAAVAEAKRMSEILDEQIQREGITHAVTGLYPPGPPHVRTMTALSSDLETWTPTGIESSSAVFTYTRGIPQEDRPESYNPNQVAFQDVEPVSVQRFEFARPKGFYDKYLYRTRTSVSEEMRIARNHMSLRSSPENLYPALRAVNRLLAEDDQNAEAFYLQAAIYSQLANWEGQISLRAGGANPADMRYIQIVMAARQAVTVNPELGNAWNMLYQVYAQRGRVDLALACLEKAMPTIRRNVVATAGENRQAALDQLAATQQQLAKAVAQIELQRDEMLKQNPAEDPNQRVMQKHAIAEQVARLGHVRAALELLQENQESMKNVPQLFARAESLRGQLLLEAGELQEAFELFLQLDGMAQQQPDAQATAFPWTTMSFLAKIGLGGYPQAEKDMAANIAVLRNPAVASPVIKGNLASLPMVAPVETILQSNLTSRWPVTHLFSCSVPMITTPQSVALPRLMQAIAQLEFGNVDAARVNLQGMFSECGQNPYRPLAASYLSLVRDDTREYITENTLDTWEAWTESDFESVVSSNASTADAAAEDEQAPAADTAGEDKPADDKPADDKPASAEPSGDESDSEKPDTEEPESTETESEEPATTEPATTEPAADKSATDNSSTEEPASEDEPAEGEPASDESEPPAEPNSDE